MKRSNWFEWIGIVICITGVLWSIFNPQAKQDEMGRAFIQEQFGEFMVSSVDSTFTKLESVLINPRMDSVEVRKLADHLYAERKQAYNSDTDTLTVSLDLLLVLMVMGIFVLFFQPKELEIPLVKIPLPDRLLYLVIPFAIFFLFLQLGLNMNACIDGRVVLEILSDNRETIGNQRVGYYYSDARTLVDQGFVDAWCTWYYDVFEGGRMGSEHQDNASYVLFVFFGTFWGLTIGACLALVSSYFERFRNWFMCALMTVIGGLAFLGWSSQMIKWYPHSALFFTWVWSVTLLALVLWMLVGKQVAYNIASRREEKRKLRETEDQQDAGNAA